MSSVSLPFVVSRSCPRVFVGKRSKVVQRRRFVKPITAVATGDPRAKWEFAEKTAGRLAMTGFTVGTCYGTVTQQWNFTEQGAEFLPLVVCLAGLISYASYKTDGIEVWPPNKPFTKGIETLNGRAAMLGLALKFLYSG